MEVIPCSAVYWKHPLAAALVFTVGLPFFFSRFVISVIIFALIFSFPFSKLLEMVTRKSCINRKRAAYCLYGKTGNTTRIIGGITV